MIAWQQIVTQHGDWLRGIITARLSPGDPIDDILQDTLQSAIERGKPAEELRDVKAWLAGIAKNKIRQHIDTRCRERRLIDKVEHPAPAQLSPDQFLLNKERSQLIEDALASLSQDINSLLRYKYLQGWSYAQIGKVMNLNRDAVTNQLRDARRQLRSRINDLYQNQHKP